MRGSFDGRRLGRTDILRRLPSPLLLLLALTGSALGAVRYVWQRCLSPGRPYRIQTSSPLAPGTWNELTNFIINGLTAINDPSAASGGKRFYRAVSP